MTQVSEHLLCQYQSEIPGSRWISRTPWGSVGYQIKNEVAECPWECPAGWNVGKHASEEVDRVVARKESRCVRG